MLSHFSAFPATEGPSTSSFCLVQALPLTNLSSFASLFFPSSGNEGRNVKEKKKNWVTKKRDNFEQYFKSMIPLVLIIYLYCFIKWHREPAREFCYHHSTDGKTEAGQV